MRFHEEGRADGPRLVLLHGLSSSHHGWRRNLAVLGQQHRLTLVQLFAAGSGRRFSVHEEAEALAHHLESGPGPVMVIAHSLGGLLALELAHGSPELVRALVLVSVPAIPLAQPAGRRLAAVAQSGARTDLASIGVVTRTLLAGNPLRLLAATGAAVRADLSGMATAVQAPSLLVWGGRDAIVPLTAGSALADVMPRARLEVIADAGHQPQWETPDAFHAAVLPFLAAPESSVRRPGTPPYGRRDPWPPSGP